MTNEQGELVVTNTLEKVVPEDPDPGSDTYTSYAAQKKWYPLNTQTDNGYKAILALEYFTKKGEWEILADIELDGKPESVISDENINDNGKSTNIAYGEDGEWHAIWKNVPKIHPNGWKADEGTVTSYRISEISHTPENYISQKLGGVTTADERGTVTFTFVNIQPTQLTVEKKWDASVTEDNQKPVKVGLYRTKDISKVGGLPEGPNDKDIEAVLEDTQDPAGEPQQKTLTLNIGNWTRTFADLPAYDIDGGLYYYYALEESVDGTPLAESGFSVGYDNETPGKTVITNIPNTSIEGTKTWLDDNNKDKKRPETLTLTLLRRIINGTEDWKPVTDAKPVWTNTDKNIWHYSYTDLPAAAPGGGTYEYKVEEEVPAGYVQKTDEASESTHSLVNILNGTTSLKVTKYWIYNETDTLPELTLKLYRSTAGVNAGDKQEVTSVVPEINKEKGSEWVYTYSGLPEYNDQGARYTYWVEETLPGGYDAESTTCLLYTSLTWLLTDRSMTPCLCR